jgi:hypothetical protein
MLDIHCGQEPFSIIWLQTVFGAGVVGTIMWFTSPLGPMPGALASDEPGDSEEASIMLTERGEGGRAEHK